MCIQCNMTDVKHLSNFRKASFLFCRKILNWEYSLCFGFQITFKWNLLYMHLFFIDVFWPVDFLWSINSKPLLYFPMLPKSYIAWHDHLLAPEYSQQLLYSMDLCWNKILLTWMFGEKQMKGDFDIYHSKYFLFQKKKWNFTVVWGFQLCSELSEETCLRMELISPKPCMFHSLFLYHPQNWLIMMNGDSGVQTLSFCGPLCCPSGNFPFLLSQVYLKIGERVLQCWRGWLLGAHY